MKRIHSIKNPESFGDCMTMLFANEMGRTPEWNMDILSGRCFHIAYGSDIKNWIYTGTSIQKSAETIEHHLGCSLDVHKISTITRDEIMHLAQRSAVLDLQEGYHLNRTVESIYFSGVHHMIYLCGCHDGQILLHDPDSAPSTTADPDVLVDIINRHGCTCVTMLEKPVREPDNTGIMLQGIRDYLNSHAQIAVQSPCQGVAVKAAFQYGLRMFLFYNYEILTAVSMADPSGNIAQASGAYFREASAGFSDCRWERFMQIEAQFRDLLKECECVYAQK